MYVPYLRMGFLDIGSKKHQGQRRQEHLILSKTTEIALLFKDRPLTTCFWARISTVILDDQVLQETYN